MISKQLFVLDKCVAEAALERADVTAALDELRDEEFI